MGVDFAGTIESVGKNVEKLKKDDEVFGMVPPDSSGGANAEYVCVSEKNVALQPVNMTYEQAAAVDRSAVPKFVQIKRSVVNLYRTLRPCFLTSNFPILSR